MNIKIKNMGPIGDSAITLKPLTILVGKNNTGKSYNAMIVYLFTKFFENISRAAQIEPDSADKFRPVLFDDMSENTKQWLFELEEKFDNNKVVNLPFSIQKEIIEKFRLNIINYANHFLKNEVERLFGTNIESLRDDDSKPLELSCHNQLMDLFFKVENDNATVDCLIDYKEEEIELDYYPEKENVSLSITMHDIAKITFEGTLIFQDSAFDLKTKPNIVWSIIVFMVLRKVYSSRTRENHYFPAARSGLLATKNLLTSELWKQSSTMRQPSIQGTIADFMSLIYTFEEKNSQYDDMFVIYEKMMLEGHLEILVKDSGEKDIYYKYQGKSVPIRLASSMVSEISPLFLFLKYSSIFENEGKFSIIIEEPESHLHPSAQLALSRLISYLVNMGHQIIITTHSPILIQQVQNLLLMHGNKDVIKKLGYAENETLDKKDVSITLFYKDNNNMTKTNDVDVMDITLSETEFDEIYTHLYEELTYLEMSLGLVDDE